MIVHSDLPPLLLLLLLLLLLPLPPPLAVFDAARLDDMCCAYLGSCRSEKIAVRVQLPCSIVSLVAPHVGKPSLGRGLAGEQQLCCPLLWEVSRWCKVWFFQHVPEWVAAHFRLRQRWNSLDNEAHDCVAYHKFVVVGLVKVLPGMCLESLASFLTTEADFRF